MNTKKELLHCLPSGRVNNSPAPPILASLSVLRAIISKENTQHSCTNKLQSAHLINKVTVPCRIIIIGMNHLNNSFLKNSK